MAYEEFDEAAVAYIFFWRSRSNKPVYMNPIFIRYVHYTIMLLHVNTVSVVSVVNTFF